MRTAIPLLILALAAGTARAEVPHEAYTHPQELVAIDGHRKLNLFCLGKGEPTVLFDSGLGSTSVAWRKVQDAVATKTRACSYDRAGYAFSDPSPNPSDVESIVGDIDKLLKAAGIKTPILYVGHSIAGLYGVALQGRHPEDIAAEVLVDPSFHDQDEAMLAGVSPEKRAGFAKMDSDEIERLRTCLDLAKRGALASPAGDTAKACIDDYLPRGKLDPKLTAVLTRQWARPTAVVAGLSETVSFMSINGGKSADRLQVEAARSSFGDKPLIVLTAGEPKGFPDLSAEENAGIDSAWKAGHDALAALSSRGRNEVVPNSGHAIHGDQPQAVIAAVEDALDQVRRARAATARP